MSILTPDQHKAPGRAAARAEDPKLLPLANELDQLARVIEQRLGVNIIPSPSISPAIPN